MRYDEILLQQSNRNSVAMKIESILTLWLDVVVMDPLKYEHLGVFFIICTLNSDGQIVSCVFESANGKNME